MDTQDSELLDDQELFDVAASLCIAASWIGVANPESVVRLVDQAADLLTDRAQNLTALNAGEAQ